MRRGLQIPGFSFPGVAPDALFEKVAEIAGAAEDAGFDSLWVMDHFHQLPMLGGGDEPIFEGYTLLAALAARTSRARLGTMVTGVTYRNPAMLAKMVTSLDVISRGRAILGIGAAWFEEEHRAYGFDFPPAGERLDRLEETLQVCRAMFRDDRATFEGRHYSIREARNIPRPIQPGGPKILIGGGGERRTLRLVAQYADGCNVFGGPDALRHKFSVLERHCADVGRDPADITKTRLVTLVTGTTQEAAVERLASLGLGSDPQALVDFVLVGDADRIAEQLAVEAEVGLDGVIVNLADAHDLEAVAIAGRAVRSVFG